MKNKISIIIPVLNEAHYIGKLLEHLLANTLAENIAEILVVDGGSQDETQQIVQSFSNFADFENKEAFNYTNKKITKEKSTRSQTVITLLNSEKGRAKQMNIGAKSASGNILYFLHADSFPPRYFDQLIINEINKGNQAGCFRMQFDSNHWWLQLASWLTKFKWRACRGGDQSQFITKTLFNTIGGYNENFMIYEDNILIDALYARKQFVVINKNLKTSARMYNKYGVWKVQYFYWTIYIKKWFGASPETLNTYYRKHLNVKNL
jgi:rSAM/selenodomain-associated transferase 2